MRKTFGTGSVWEQKLGYSRAVQVDNTLYISATSASGENGIVGSDFYEQTPDSRSPTSCIRSCT
jgi:enamine deaminase RidA (YjgF/YER057c/UK114 family)